MSDSAAYASAVPVVPWRPTFLLFSLQSPGHVTVIEQEASPLPCHARSDELSDCAEVGYVGESPETVYVRQVADFADTIRRRSRELVERIELKLDEDREEAAIAEDVAPSEAAVQACLALAERLAPHLALAPQLKSGAFTEDDGGISLVLQSLVTDRRLNCRIGCDGTVVSTIRINESMQADSIGVSLSDEDAPREMAEWVTNRR